MPTFEEVQQNLTFLNTGPTQTPGLIVMKLDANGGNYGSYKHIVVLFNATNASVTFTNSQLQGLALHLHPVQQNSSDPATRQSTFNSNNGDSYSTRADNRSLCGRNRVVPGTLPLILINLP